MQTAELGCSRWGIADGSTSEGKEENEKGAEVILKIVATGPHDLHCHLQNWRTRVYTLSIHDRFKQGERKTMKGSVTEYATRSIEEAK
jgi:hypothetical protein